MFFFLFSLETNLYFSHNTLLLEVDLGQAHTYFEYGSDFQGKSTFSFKNNAYAQERFFLPEILKEEDQYFLGYKKKFYLSFKQKKNIKDELLINFVYCENKICKIDRKKIQIIVNQLKSIPDEIYKKIPRRIDKILKVKIEDYLPYEKKIYPYTQFNLTKKGFILNEKNFEALTEEGIVQVQLEKTENLLWIYLLALLGGLILNFMPCVLPVLGFKLSIRQNKSVYLNYTLGIFFTFFIFALLAVLLKNFQWGFQFQSPYFLFFFSLLILALLIDIYGNKNFFNQFSKVVPFFDQVKGFKDFFDGFLSTLLSTPCTGPFLTTALGASLILEPLQIFTLFSFMALGFSFPVLLFMIFPQIRILPKGGPWLDTFKELINSSLIFLFLWILHLSLFNIKSYYYLATLGSFFLFFIIKNSYLKKIFILLFFLFSYSTFKKEKDVFTTILNPYSINEDAFIAFTANWCLTCQFNKKILFNKDFFNYVESKKLNLIEVSLDEENLRANDFLEEHGVRGIPAYFIKINNETKYLGGFFTEKDLL